MGNNSEAFRKLCLKRQTELRALLKSSDQQQAGLQLFMSQHAMLHSARMAQTEPWSFEDEVFQDTTEEQVRRILPKCEHSIVWNIWHIARIEDVAMNMLVAGSPQVMLQGDWLERLGIPVLDTGNGMNQDGIAGLSAAIRIEALRDYRAAVGCRTRKIVMQLQPHELKVKVDISRLAQVRDQGAVIEAASGLLDYWSRRDIAGLLLMPASRHNLVHLNEALQLKGRRS